MGKKTKPQRFQILIVGAKGIGKYSLKQQYVKGWIAPKDFAGPAGSDYKLEVINGQKYEIAATDCRDLSSIDESVHCDGVALTYNISDKQSLDHLKTIVYPFLLEKFKNANTNSDENTKIEDNTTELTANVGLSIPALLLGNKVDEAKLSRAVEEAEGKKLSDELSCVGFYETSATCNVNIAQAFKKLAEEIVKSKTVNDSDLDSHSNGCCLIL